MCQIQLPKTGLSKARAPRGATTKMESNVHIIAGLLFVGCFDGSPFCGRTPTIAALSGNVCPPTSQHGMDSDVLQPATPAPPKWGHPSPVGRVFNQGAISTWSNGASTSAVTPKWESAPPMGHRRQVRQRPPSALPMQPQTRRCPAPPQRPRPPIRCGQVASGLTAPRPTRDHVALSLLQKPGLPPDAV